MENGSINEISILIPTYNYVCTNLVSCLQKQAEAIAVLSPFSLMYEIIVADDGSTDEMTITSNKRINELENCHYIISDHNRGRAAIRNYLAEQSHYDYLLFIDSDMTIADEHFIENYLKCGKSSQVVYGGITIGNHDKLSCSNLRYKYEKAAAHKHSVPERKKNPYLDFHTANFCIKRDLIFRYPFDSRFRKYGYEDVLLGKVLAQNKIKIEHIYNPTVFNDFETNSIFLAKTEEGLDTLLHFQDELNHYSTLLALIEKLRRWHAIPLIKLIHTLSARSERNHLTGNHPSLLIFNLYKLGYFISKM